MKPFTNFEAALAYAKKHAQDYCLTFHRWRVLQVNNKFAIGIFNVVTGQREAYVI